LLVSVYKEAEITSKWCAEFHLSLDYLNTHTHTHMHIYVVIKNCRIAQFSLSFFFFGALKLWSNGTT